LGIGDWGLGIGDWGFGAIPNPQSPIPKSPIPILLFLIFINNKLLNINIKSFINYNLHKNVFKK